MSRQAHSLDVLKHTVDQHAPNRSTRSDGGIGDASHAARTSDHNPNSAGVWRAFDFTHDPKHLPGTDLANRLAKLLGKHPAMMSGAYVIWSRHIISFDRLSEGWRPYSGASAHTEHVHLSVSTRAAGYDSRDSWPLWTPQDTAPTVTPYEHSRALVDEAIRTIRTEVGSRRVRAHDYAEALSKVQSNPLFPTK